MQNCSRGTPGKWRGKQSCWLRSEAYIKSRNGSGNISLNDYYETHTNSGSLLWSSSASVLVYQPSQNPALARWYETSQFPCFNMTWYGLVRHLTTSTCINHGWAKPKHWFAYAKYETAKNNTETSNKTKNVIHFFPSHSRHHLVLLKLLTLTDELNSLTLSSN